MCICSEPTIKGLTWWYYLLNNGRPRYTFPYDLQKWMPSAMTKCLSVLISFKLHRTIQWRIIVRICCIKHILWTSCLLVSRLHDIKTTSFILLSDVAHGCRILCDEFCTSQSLLRIKRQCYMIRIICTQTLWYLFMPMGNWTRNCGPSSYMIIRLILRSR